MFDLVGLATTNGTPLPACPSIHSAFTSDPWAHHEHVRLKIDSPECRVIALKRAADPEDYAECDGCQLFLVGEAFARRSSAEPTRGRLPASTLLRAYQERGATLVDAIKGNFTILILDKSRQTFYILSSHFAVSPFYYTSVYGTVYFSTSLAELGCLLPQKPALDLAAVVEVALFNWPVHERTFLKDVKRIAPGTILSISRDGIVRQTYWDQRPLYRVTLLERSEALEQGSELFHACANAMVSD